MAPVVGDVGVENGVDGIAEEAEEGSRKVKKMLDPLLPRDEEVLEHNLTHLPFRNWCHIFVNAKGRDMAAVWMSEICSQRREFESNAYFDPSCKYYYQNYIYQHDT